MRLIAVMIPLLLVITTSWAQRNGTAGRRKPMQTESETGTIVPALEKYAQGSVAQLWKRPGLSRRDRSIVTVTALIARSDHRDALLL
jgi:4-carboxymuconolactone decarboxylase